MNGILRYRWYCQRRRWRDAGRLCRKKKKPVRRAVVMALWAAVWVECLTVGMQHRGDLRRLFGRMMKVEKGVEVVIEDKESEMQRPEDIRTYGFSLRWKEGNVVFYRIHETLRKASGSEK